VFTAVRHRSFDWHRQLARRPSGSFRLSCWLRGRRRMTQPQRCGSQVAEVERITGKRPGAVRVLAHWGCSGSRGGWRRQGWRGCNAMSDDDALVADMHRLLGFLKAAPPVADQDRLERLLAGRLDPGDAPPGYVGLARLLAAATAPPGPEELAGEQLVVAEFAAVVPSPPPTLVPRRATMPSKVFSVKAAAAVLAALLSIGGVAAAATGLLPGQAEPLADQAASTTGAGAAGHGLVGDAAVVDLDAAAKTGLCRAWQAGQGTDNGRRAESPAFRALAVAAGGADNVAAYCKDATATDKHGAAAGPDARGAARDGLCRAWQAGQGADNGRRADSVAFQALAAAAGGADKIAAYCQTTTAASSAGTHGPGLSRTSVSASSTTVSPPSSGPPADPGSGGGQGQGGPPTTTG